MLYTLPNGKEIVLEDVIRVSKVRDQGEDASSIEYSKMTFTIYFNKNEIIEVSEKYHFADWSEKKLKLASLRADLVAKWKSVVKDADDS